MDRYNFSLIEKKWQKIWDESKCFAAENNSDKEKYYVLIEFPFPSAQGLHIGHPRSYTMLDVIARKKRMEGKNVLFPIGFDSFGLPTENYAIKTNIHPRIVTDVNVENFTRQLKMLGLSFDWDRCIRTSDPSYYRWTQWIFLQLFKNNLAYKAKININFCTSCKVGLSNEEVVNGKCERCGSDVIRREKEQWMLKITKYADRLIDDLDELDYVSRVKLQQKNWIGRSYGASINFSIVGTDDKLEVFTTRPDTIYGATYMVLAPEHPLIDKNKDRIENYHEVEEYRLKTKKKSDFERTQLVKEKTGVKLIGINAFNPVSKVEVPIYISDYVMMDYGTGAIMAVPAHDKRDYEFAEEFGAKILPVIECKNEELPYSGDGVVINSPIIDGLDVKSAKEKMIEFVEENGIGKRETQYKLRDWVFSRQRYWGEPIPIINCDTCGHVPLEESDLPLELPDVDTFLPGEDGSSPLSKIDSWVNVKCPKCGRDAKRETDTMPQWAGSSWYFLRYLDPFNDKELASKESIDYWMPVDWYNGGMEHTTLHMLYSRFWYKFLYDIGVVNTSEPYRKRTSHGFILGEDGGKMSKSRGNVINPDEIVENYGADSLRVYELFIGDFEKAVNWSTQGLGGMKKFIDRIWNAYDLVDLEKTGYSEDLVVLIHQTIKKVSYDYENLKANTAIAQLMTLTNAFYKKESITKTEFETLLKLLNPVAPHITEELYSMLGNESTIAMSSWPEYKEELTIEDTVELPVQINGKVRFKFKTSRNKSKTQIEEILKLLPDYSKYTDGKNVVKIIVIPEKLVSIVVK